MPNSGSPTRQYVTTRLPRAIASGGTTAPDWRWGKVLQHPFLSGSLGRLPRVKRGSTKDK